MHLCISMYLDVVHLRFFSVQLLEHSLICFRKCLVSVSSSHVKVVFFSAMCQVSLPKIDTSGEYAPMKFSLEYYTCNSNNTGKSTGVEFYPYAAICCTISPFSYNQSHK